MTGDTRQNLQETSTGPAPGRRVKQARDESVGLISLPPTKPGHRLSTLRGASWGRAKEVLRWVGCSAARKEGAGG